MKLRTLAPYAADFFDEISLFKNVGLGQFQVSKDSLVSGKRILDTKERELRGPRSSGHSYRRLDMKSRAYWKIWKYCC